jgi:putative protease
MADKLIGKITHYYGKIGVAIVELSGVLKAGDQIKIKDHEAGFEQAVGSMQVDYKNVDTAKKGDVIGLKVDQKVKEGDGVYLIQ